MAKKNKYSTIKVPKKLARKLKKSKGKKDSSIANFINRKIFGRKK